MSAYLDHMALRVDVYKRQVVDHGVLEDAQKHPEKYPDLIVRVAGYSAVFVHLSKDIQDELLSRMLYD